MKRVWIIVITGIVVLVFTIIAGAAFLGKDSTGRINNGKSIAGLIESVLDAADGTSSEGTTSSDPAEGVSGPGSGSTEGSQGFKVTSTEDQPTPQPTIVLPPELCAADDCNIPVAISPTEVDDPSDCARFTEAESAAPLLFQMPRSLVTSFSPAQGTLHVEGTFSLQTPTGDITFQKADITFERYDPGLGGFERIVGRVEFPGELFIQPGFGMLDRSTMVEVGLDRGQALSNLQVPLCPNRQYLYFNFDSSSGAEARAQDGSSFSYQVSGGSVFIFDPLDPGFLFHVEVPGVGTGGYGKSISGLIPYTPLTNWSVAEKLIPFTAHVYQYAQGVELTKYLGIPLEVDGFMAIDADPDNNSQVDLGQIGLNPLTGDGFLQAVGDLLDRSSDFAIGQSGGLSVGLPVPGDLEIKVQGENLFDFDLADASMGIYVSDGGSQAYFSGIAGSDFVYPLLPLQPAGSLKTAGYISSELWDFELRQEGEYVLRAGKLMELAPFELTPLRVRGSVLSNIEGITLRGTALSRIHPEIVFEGETAVEAGAFFREPGRSYLKMSGMLAMAAHGVEGDAGLTVDASGLEIAGALYVDTGRIVQADGVSVGTLLVQGSLRPETGGYRLLGVTSSQIHPVVEMDGQVDVEAFLSPDPSRAYFSVHGDLIIAGVRLADARLTASASGVRVEGIQQTPLNSIHLQGSITDAGPDLRGSVEVHLPIELPASTLGGLKILGKCLPSAEIRSCTIDSPWPIPDVPGLTHQLIGNVCVPSPVGGFDNCSISTPPVRLGDLRGSVNLQLGIGGLGGGLDASFCPASGSCQSLSGGRLVLGPEPQACVTVPVLNREVCAPF